MCGKNYIELGDWSLWRSIPATFWGLARRRGQYSGHGAAWPRRVDGPWTAGGFGFRCHSDTHKPFLLCGATLCHQQGSNGSCHRYLGTLQDTYQGSGLCSIVLLPDRSALIARRRQGGSDTGARCSFLRTHFHVRSYLLISRTPVT